VGNIIAMNKHIEHVRDPTFLQKHKNQNLHQVIVDFHPHGVSLVGQASVD
jgi:hypothetical protein